MKYSRRNPSKQCYEATKESSDRRRPIHNNRKSIPTQSRDCLPQLKPSCDWEEIQKLTFGDGADHFDAADTTALSFPVCRIAARSTTCL